MLLENTNIKAIKEAYKPADAVSYFKAGWKLLSVFPVVHKDNIITKYVFVWDRDGEPIQIK